MAWDSSEVYGTNTGLLSMTQRLARLPSLGRWRSLLSMTRVERVTRARRCGFGTAIGGLPCLTANSWCYGARTKWALSAITVQSFADLGYGVDVTQADPYTLPGAASKPVAKIALPGPDRPGLDASVSWPHFYLQRGEGPHGHRRVEGDFPSILTAGGHTGGPDRAERVWDRGMAFDIAESRQRWDAASPSRTTPELTCGAGLMNDPIYVVDPQGRIVRTISR